MLPAAVRSRAKKQLVLHRSSRQLILLEQGQLRLRVPAAVGTQGWETPLGEHRVLFKAVDPVWRHPGTGALVPPGGRNPLGSRWIAFYQDCSNPGGWDGEKVVQVRGCSHVGLHGTPHRWTVGRAVSHGCVRLYDEHIRRVFDLVDVGTPVGVLPWWLCLDRPRHKKGGMKKALGGPRAWWTCFVVLPLDHQSP